MDRDTRTDLRLIGNGSANGGYYDTVRIVGDGAINGDFDCLSLKSIGNSKLGGNTRAAEASFVGSAVVSGNLDSDDARVSGNLDVRGSVKSQELIVRGGIETKGGLDSEDLTIKGYATIGKDCTAERFLSHGQLDIGGLLNAERIEIRMYSGCTVNEIGGKRIVARRGRAAELRHLLKSLFLPSSFDDARLVTNTIEGDDVRLEHTKADVVRGKSVRIGSGCDIGLVEYREEFYKTGRSTIREKRKIS